LGSVVYTCRRLSKSVPLKRMASSQNFFVWFCGVLICQRGIRPCRTKSCGISDPAEQWQSCVNFIADTCSAGSDTPQNNILRGLKPRGTTFINEYFSEFKKEFKKISGCEFGDYMGSIHGKNQRSKISCYCPFKSIFFPRSNDKSTF
jgi:hypothetical protein